jgi:5-methylcytosine-specific restriction endonuclease McrA
MHGEGAEITNHDTRRAQMPAIKRGGTYGQWRKFRREIFKRDKWTCQTCKTRHWPKFRGILEADHITALADGGAEFDEANVQTLCKQCHRQKTTAWLTKPKKKEATK